MKSNAITFAGGATFLIFTTFSSSRLDRNNLRDMTGFYTNKCEVYSPVILQTPDNQ